MCCVQLKLKERLEKADFHPPNSLLRSYKIGSREKKTKMDAIREWKSKTLEPEQVFGVCLMHRKEDFIRMYSFDQQCYQKRLKLDEIGVVPVPRFYRPRVKQDDSTRDRCLHRRSVRFISPLIVELCALDQSL